MAEGSDTQEPASLDRPIVAEFVMNDPYYRQNFAEWVTTALPGIRFLRASFRRCIGLAALIGLYGFASGDTSALMLAAFLVALAAPMIYAYFQRRQEWLSHVRTGRNFGDTMRLAIVGSSLVQIKDFDGDPRYQRQKVEDPKLGQTDRVIKTPNGYLLRYKTDVDVFAPGQHFQKRSASLYIPRSSIKVPPGPEEFESAVGASEWDEAIDGKVEQT